MTRIGIPRWAKFCLIALAAIAVFVVVFRLGSRSSAAVALSDPVVWVEDGARGRILQINGSTQEVIGAVEVTESTNDVLAALPNGRDAVFLNRTVGEYGEIGAVDLEAVNRIETGLSGDGLADAVFLSALDPDSQTNNAFVVASNEVLVYAGGSTEPLTIPVSGLGDVVTTPTGKLVAATADGSRLLISGDSGMLLLTDLPEPAGDIEDPVGLVRSGDSIYAVDSSRRTIREVNIDNGELGDPTSVCGSLNDAQLGGNVLSESDGTHRVLVHDASSGVLSVSDPRDGRCVEIALSETGSNFGPPVAVDDVAYLPNYETGQVVVVDLAERVILRTHAFTPVRDRAFELEVFDGAVWANEPNGVRVAVINATEIESISKQLNVRVVGVGDDGSEAVGGGSISENADGQRVFGERGDLFEGFQDRDVGAVPGDAIALGGGDDAQVVGEGGVDPVDGELLSGEVAELVSAPVVLEAADLAADDQTLIANFNFSSPVVSVGEELRLTDDSTGNPTQWVWDFGDGTGATEPEVVKVWDTEGVYTVTMLITNAAGDEAQQSFDFTVVSADVLRPPSADFSFDSETIEVGQPLQFTDTSTGEPDSLLWAFGDGTTDVGASVTKVFEVEGVYEVTLTATNAAGSDSDSALITVVPGGSPPEAVIAPVPTTIDTGQTITLLSESTNSPTSTSWDFGDGSTENGTEVRHSWDTPGEYRITLTVANATGQDTTFRTIFVEPAIEVPDARFNESSLTVIAGETLSFNSTSINNPTSLVWEFGDGSTAEGANVTNSWATPGSYTVTLTAANAAGSDSTAKTVTVLPIPIDPPTANFRVASATVSVGELVNFIDQSTGDPTDWQWNFRDGAPAVDSTAQNPAHAFNAPGTYEVLLTASNDGGSSTFTRTIVVIDPPVASFTREINELIVALSDTSTNNPTSWMWDFGDGTTSTQQNPTKTFGAPGTYEISLVASNDAGDSTAFTQTVTVAEQPNADFTFVRSGLTVQFTDTSTGAPVAWSWDMGDGVTVADPTQNPTKTFAAPGTYTVELTVSNAAGSDTHSEQITVNLAPPEAIFTCTVVGAGVSCDGSASTGAVNYAWSAPNAISGPITSGAGEFATFTFPNSGSFPITLTVENASGVPDSDTQNVTVTLPKPEITNITDSSTTPGVVQLAGTATESPTSWTWTTTGPGTVTGGTTANPTITYTAAGTYTVTATATNANGTSDPETHPVTVVLPPVISAVNQTESPPGSVTLSTVDQNNPTGWTWTVNGANAPTSQTGPNPTFTFPTNGTYNGTVTATNGAGAGNTFPFTVTVSQIPVAPVLGPITVTQGTGGVFTVSTTTTSGTISWTINNGATPSTATGPSATFTAPANGSYLVTATATNGTLTGTANATVVVTSIPPVATVSATASGTVPLGINAVHTGSAQPGATYTWSINGGATITSGAGTPSATFQAPVAGSYDVTLTVTDLGGTDTQTVPISVP